MKTAICYYSRHHGNTLKVLEAMTEGTGIDLIDVTGRVAVHLEDYDCIGLASGIYYSKFHRKNQINVFLDLRPIIPYTEKHICAQREYK